ncbi:Glutamate racemase [hydrothermal vent metagenome]|uniref:glutamate racemase n=1 Tax=hydrothermal vent metagenome TaxID=652676 RepID=A0A3B0XG28_9ZZZZ
MINESPIGVFDSGVGGLSIACKIRDILPNENLLYVADSAHTPYGDKSEAYVYERAVLILQFLIERKVKAVVVACNTVTVSAIQKLRSEFSVPVIGVEPGIKPAVSKTRSGVIGVLATTQTLSSTSFNNLSGTLSETVKIEIQPCPGLVEQVESLELMSQKTRRLVRKYVFPLLDKGADKIVLGCTHYAFLAPLIGEIAGPDIEIINTATAVARETARRLQAERLLSVSDLSGIDEFCSSGAEKIANKQFSQLWGAPVKVHKILSGHQV